MTARQQHYERLKEEYTNVASVQRMAYALWEQDGCPNGDEVVETPLGVMRRREYHWLHAKSILEHFADVDADMMARG